MKNSPELPSDPWKGTCATGRRPFRRARSRDRRIGQGTRCGSSGISSPTKPPTRTRRSLRSLAASRRSPQTSQPKPRVLTEPANPASFPPFPALFMFLPRRLLDLFKNMYYPPGNSTWWEFHVAPVDHLQCQFITPWLINSQMICAYVASTCRQPHVRNARSLIDPLGRYVSKREREAEREKRMGEREIKREAERGRAKEIQNRKGEREREREEEGRDREGEERDSEREGNEVLYHFIMRLIHSSY